MLDTILSFMTHHPIISFFLICVIAGIIWGILEKPMEAHQAKKARKADDERRQRGEDFEEATYKHLKKHFARDSISRNVLIPLENGRTAECDMVMVNSKGIFCIECKEHMTTNSIGGRRYGAWNAGPTDTNPLEQNDYHCRTLCKYLYDQLGQVFMPVNIVAQSCPFTFEYFGKRYDDQSYYGHLTCKTESQLPFGIIHEDSFTGVRKFAKDVKSMPDKLSRETVRQLSSIIENLQGTMAERQAHAARVSGTYQA